MTIDGDSACSGYRTHGSEYARVGAIQHHKFGPKVKVAKQALSLS